MSQRAIFRWVVFLAATGALTLPAWAVVRQDAEGQAAVATSSTVTGAGAGTFNGSASYAGVPLSGLRFGMGMATATDGTASGDFQSALLGGTVAAPRVIAVEGKAGSGSVQNGVARFSGISRVDLGDGSPALQGVPFTLTVVPGPVGRGTLTLTLGTTSLPLATATQGSITVR